MRYFIIVFLLMSLMSHSQKGTLIVLNKSDDTADLIDLESRESVVTLPTGDGPHEVAISPDEKTAVITNYGRKYWPGSSLTVIDIPNKKVVKTISLSYKAPHGIEFIDENRLLVTCEESKRLVIINYTTGRAEGNIDTQQETSHMVVYSPKYKRAFVANIRSGSISVVDVENRTLEKIIKTGNGAEGLTLSADESEVWVTNRADNTISIVNTESLTIEETLVSKEFPIRAKGTADGKYILVSNAKTGDVHIFEASTRKLVKNISMEVTAKEKEASRLFQDFDDSPVPVGILILPDNSFAFVANTNADVITVIDLEKMEITDRLTAGKEPDGLGYSSIMLK
ncbi:beta-propeller fold lactonase family protein [Flavobacteriaceae bacterium M23B6Z8]